MNPSFRAPPPILMPHSGPYITEPLIGVIRSPNEPPEPTRFKNNFLEETINRVSLHPGNQSCEFGQNDV